MTSPVPEVVASVGATLGEGPIWIDHALWFVDIKAPCVYRFRPGDDGLQRWQAPSPVGWILPTETGLLAGLKTGVHRFDPADGSFTDAIVIEPDVPGNRLNDATVGPDGTIWLGSMDDSESDASGRFYRLDRRGVVETGLPPAVVTNGPAISPDGRTLYVTDTFAGLIRAVPVANDGTLGEPRPFVTIAKEDGHPDGPTVDAEGCVWTGLFGGWGVRRYDPDGTLIAIVRFPVANITKIAFGGPDLRIAYATTARLGLDAGALAAQPLAGDLFAFDAGVAGLPTPRARL